MADADRARWNARYAGDEAARAPSAWVSSLDAVLPRQGRALDLAGGTGRHAIWLAQRGLDVTLTDISDVALATAEKQAAAKHVSITCVQCDLESSPLPAGPWDLVLSVHYLQRALFEQFPTILAPRGLLVFVQPTRSNLARHAKPSARFLLDDGELPHLVRGLTVTRYEEGWFDEGRHEARMIATRAT